VRLHNLHRRKFLLAYPYNNFRNRSKNYFVHVQALERMCPLSLGQARWNGRPSTVETREL
jgi:hypothetical protein